MAVYRVEIGYEATTSLATNVLILDDPVKGTLDAGNVLGGGSFFYDVTSYVKSLSISRGKSRQLDRYSSGQASVDFINQTRAFDPTYTASPFYGQIIPKRTLRIFIDNHLSYVGIIDDWDLRYSPSGDSIATANCSDAFVLLANRSLTAQTYSSQLSGARVNAVLDDPLVSFPLAEREIDDGFYLLGSNTIGEQINSLSYLQLVEASEGGDLFISADGKVVFREKNSLGQVTPVRFTDDGTGIPYGDLNITYGSELLYNEINIASTDGVDTATAGDINSQLLYGISTLDLPNILITDLTELQSLADFYLNRFKEPELRFDSIRVNCRKLSDSQVASLLSIELSDLVEVVFTPNGIGPAIEQYAQVIGIGHEVNLDTSYITFKLGQVPRVPLRLDSTVFGRIDVNALG